MRPMMRPGIWRTCSGFVAMKPKYGPPDDSGTPSGWPSPQAMSAPFVPHSPGGFSTASDVGLTTPITSALFACAQSVTRIDVLERAEEVRLLDHDGGDVLALVRLERRQYVSGRSCGS